MGGVLRWVCLGAGAVLLLASAAMGQVAGHLGIGLLIGLVLLIAAGALGWVLWLRHAVFGEMIYLVLDLAEIFRRTR